MLCLSCALPPPPQALGNICHLGSRHFPKWNTKKHHRQLVYRFGVPKQKSGVIIIVCYYRVALTNCGAPSAAPCIGSFKR
jgi:hypothetical protein